MIEPIEVGGLRACEWRGDPARTAIVLPGAMLGGAPSCYDAALTLFEAGWRVGQVWDGFALAYAGDGLRRRTAPALLVGGTADETWNGTLARELSDEVLELDGADHGLANVEHLPLLIDAVRRFAA